jgi:hypothetical protein
MKMKLTQLQPRSLGSTVSAGIYHITKIPNGTPLQNADGGQKSEKSSPTPLEHVQDASYPHSLTKSLSC